MSHRHGNAGFVREFVKWLPQHFSNIETTYAKAASRVGRWKELAERLNPAPANALRAAYERSLRVAA